MVARIISGPRLLMTALLSTFFFLRIMKRWNDLSPLIFTEHYPSLDSFKYHINIIQTTNLMPNSFKTIFNYLFISLLLTPANKLFSKLRGMKFQVGDILNLSALLTLSSS